MEKLFNKVKVSSSCQETLWLLFLIFFYLHLSRAILPFGLSGTVAGDLITLSKAAKGRYEALIIYFLPRFLKFRRFTELLILFHGLWKITACRDILRS